VNPDSNEGLARHTGYILYWLLGIPIPILLLAYGRVALRLSKTAGVTSRRPLGSKRTNLIARLAGHRSADRHLVFHARAAHVRAALCRGLAVVRLAVQGHYVCPVRLDFVVCP